jgi:hypothetical protein
LKRFGDVGNGHIVFEQHCEDGATGRVGKGRKGEVEFRGHRCGVNWAAGTVNRLVECSVLGDALFGHVGAFGGVLGPLRSWVCIFNHMVEYERWVKFASEGGLVLCASGMDFRIDSGRIQI